MSYVPSANDDDARSITVAKILPRFRGDVRDLKPEHVIALAQTIDDVGLIQSIAIDQDKRLLAGKHRLAACQLLIALRGCQTVRERVAAFDKIIGHETGDKFAQVLTSMTFAGFSKFHPGDAIPCRIMSVSSERDPDGALDLEIIENEKRRDFTPHELTKYADRLRTIGYSDAPGRPDEDTKRLRPALALLIGKSERTVRRMLETPAPKKETVTPQTTVSTLPGLLKAIGRALPEIKESHNVKLKHLVTPMEKLYSELEKYLDEQQ